MVTLIVLLVIVGLSMLIGLGRGITRTTIRLCMAVASIPVAVVLSQMLISTGMEIALPEIEKMLMEDPNFANIAQAIFANDYAIEGVSVLAQIFLTSIVFIVVYLLVALLGLIVGGIVSLFFRGIIRKEKQKKSALGKLVGALFGAVAGVVFLCAIYAPMGGFLSMTVDATTAMEEQGKGVVIETGDGEEIDIGAMLESVESDPILSFLQTVGGSIIFDNLTAAEYQDEEVKLSEEFSAMLSCFLSLSALTSDVDNEAVNSEALSDIAEAVQDTKLTRGIVAAILADEACVRSMLGSTDEASEFTALINAIYGGLGETDEQRFKNANILIDELPIMIGCLDYIAVINDEASTSEERTDAMVAMAEAVKETLVARDILASLIADEEFLTNLIIEQMEASPLADLLPLVQASLGVTEGERLANAQALIDELPVVVAFANYLTPFMSKPVQEWNEEEAQAIQSLVDDIETLEFSRTLVANLIQSATEAWSNDEVFAGVEPLYLAHTSTSVGGENLSVDELLNPTLKALYDAFSGTTPDTINANMQTLANLFAFLTAEEFFAMFGEENADNGMLEAFLEPDENGNTFLYHIMFCMKDDPTLWIFIPEVYNLCVRAIGQSFGVSSDAQSIYTSFVTEIYIAFNTVSYDNQKERTVYLADKLDQIFKSYGLDHNPEVGLRMALAMVEAFGDRVDLAGEEMTAWLIAYIDNALTEDVISSRIDALAGDYTPKIIFMIGTFLGISGDILTETETLTEDEQIALVRQWMTANANVIAEDLGMLSSFASMEDFLTNRTAQVDLLLQNGDPVYQGLSAEEKVALIDDTETFILTLYDMLALLDGEIDLTKAIGLIDEANRTSSLVLQKAKGLSPEESSHNLANALLFTEFLKEKAALQGSIYDTLSDVFTSDSDSLASVVHATEILDILQSDEGVNEEECKEAVEDLFDTLDENSAKDLAKFASPDVLAAFDVPESSADAVSKTLTELFNQIGEAKAADWNDGALDAEQNSSLTEEEKQAAKEKKEKEIQATETLLNVALSMTDSEETNFFDAEGTAGKCGATAEEIVDAVMNSEIVSSALLNATAGAESQGNLDADSADYDNIFDVTMSEEDKTALNDALDNKLAELETLDLPTAETADDLWSAEEPTMTEQDYQKRLIAIGALFGSGYDVVA